jgi:hypothetical protein
MSPLQKRAAIDSSLLRQPGILRHVLSYVGPGSWCFLSTVCSWLKEAYVSLSAAAVAKLTEHAAYKAAIMCIPQMTLLSSVFESPLRLRLAHQQFELTLTSRQCQFAAGYHADIDTLTVAHELGMAYTTDVLLGAARAGALSKLQWLCAQCSQQELRSIDRVAWMAAKAGSIPMLKWVRQQGVVLDYIDCATAAEFNQLPALQYLRSEGCNWDGSVLAAAAKSGALELLRWAHKHGCPWQDYVLNDDDNYVLAAHPNSSVNNILQDAAEGGSIELLRWLQQQLPHLDYNDHVMCGAARGGHVAMCEHLRANGCPWTSEACEEAAGCDHVDTLRWLREHKCPCDIEAVCVAAAESTGSPKVMAYLLAEGLLNAELLTTMLNVAGALDQLAAAQWLRQQGAEWPAVLRNEELRQSWHSATLAWARAEGCTSPLQ